jgi:hypothetical protein
MFSCDTDGKDLPPNDSKYDSYSCGSDSTNTAMITFGTITLAIMIMIWFKQEILMKWRENYMQPVEGKGSIIAIENILNSLERILKSMTYYILLLGMLIYGLLKITSSTYTFTYIWTISSVYVTGTSAGVVIFLFLVGLLMLLIVMLQNEFGLLITPTEQHENTNKDNDPDVVVEDQRHGNESKMMTSSDNTQSEDETNASTSKSTWNHSTIWAISMIILNIMLVTTVNGLYVSAVSAGYRTDQLIAFTIFLSTFKLVWNYVIISGWTNNDENSDDVYQRGDYASRIQLTTTSERAVIGICLFNNLLAPFFAELFVSPDCFLYIVNQAPNLKFFYNSLICFVVNIDHSMFMTSQLVCNADALNQLNIVSESELIVPAPFHYSYQCSFSLIANYCYVFIFRYILSGLFEPLLVWVLKYMQSKTGSSLYFHEMVTRFTPVIWRLDCDNTSKGLERSLEAVEVSLSKWLRLRRKLFAQFVVDVAMIICFGPPLAFVIGLTIWKNCWDIRLALGQLEQLITINVERYPELHDRLMVIRRKMHHEFVGGEYVLRDGLWAAICVSVWLWAFVLFDILAPQDGVFNSVAIMIVTILLPYFLYQVSAYFFVSHRSTIERYCLKRVKKQEPTIPSDQVEVNPIIIEMTPTASVF